MAPKFKIKKGDQVVVTTGRDKGRRGEVIQVLREETVSYTHLTLPTTPVV